MTLFWLYTKFSRNVESEKRYRFFDSVVGNLFGHTVTKNRADVARIKHAIVIQHKRLQTSHFYGPKKQCCMYVYNCVQIIKIIFILIVDIITLHVI